MNDKTPEQLYEEKYPLKDFNKTEYNFVAEEVTKMQSLDTISQLGQMSQMMLDKYVQTDPLKRVGVKNSPDVGILYDIPKKKFVVYSPKVWCGNCQNKKATQSYKDRVWCDDCLKIEQIKEDSLKSTDKKSKK